MNYVTCIEQAKKKKLMDKSIPHACMVEALYTLSGVQDPRQLAFNRGDRIMIDVRQLRIIYIYIYVLFFLRHQNVFGPHKTRLPVIIIVSHRLSTIVKRGWTDTWKVRAIWCHRIMSGWSRILSSGLSVPLSSVQQSDRVYGFHVFCADRRYCSTSNAGDVLHYVSNIKYL